MACPLPFPVRLRQSVSLLRPRPVQPRAGGGSQAGVGSTAWTGPGKRPEGGGRSAAPPPICRTCAPTATPPPPPSSSSLCSCRCRPRPCRRCCLTTASAELRLNSSGKRNERKRGRRRGVRTMKKEGRKEGRQGRGRDTRADQTRSDDRMTGWDVWRRSQRSGGS